MHLSSLSLFDEYYTYFGRDREYRREIGAILC